MIKDKKSSGKDMQIDMSLLSSAQKQLCIKLLAQSNINFSQDKNGFSAQLKINPNDMPTQFFIQKKQQQKNTPKNHIKNKQKSKAKNQKAQRLKTPNGKSNSGINAKENNNPKKAQKQQVKDIKTEKFSQVLINHNPKKQVSKLVKINNLKKLQQLHPFVQLYIYPKRMQFNSMIEQYWNQKNGKVASTTPLNKNFSKNQQKNIMNNKRIDKSVTFQNIEQSFSEKSKGNSFADWVYKNYVCQYPQKVKIQQNFVNLIESLNHYCYKHKGLSLFYKFLSQQYSLQLFHYFLVIRALLEQVYQDKIIDRRCNYNSRSGYNFRLKINPYQKLIQEEKVYEFLQVCCCSQGKQSQRQDEKIHRMFVQMTRRMHFDEKKKKNYISFFQMVQIFLQEFKNLSDTLNSNLQLSQSNINESFNDFIKIDGIKQNYQNQPKFQEESQIQSYFQVQNVWCNPQDKLQRQGLKIHQQKPFDYYIPKQAQAEQKFQIKFKNEIMKSFEDIHCRMGIKADSICQQSKQILECLIDSLTSMNKSKWLDLLHKISERSQRKQNFLQNNNLDFVYNESAQILFIQRLQQDYRQMVKSKVMQKSNIKKILSCHQLRINISKQVRQNLW